MEIALRNTFIFVKMGDLLSNTGKFLESSKVSELNLFLIQNLKLVAIVEAILSEWRLNVKRSQVQPQHLRPPQLSDTLFVFIDQVKTNLALKTTLQRISNIKKTPPTCLEKQKKESRAFGRLEKDLPSGTYCHCWDQNQRVSMQVIKLYNSRN